MHTERATTGKSSGQRDKNIRAPQEPEYIALGEQESRESRHIFSEESDHVSRSEALEEVTSHTSTSVNFHKLVLSPGVDEPVEDWRAWTRETMSDLEALLVSCLLLQMFAAWIRLANRSPQGALPRPIACYLDECGSAGSVPRMEDLIATLRSRHVALVLACQGFTQVEERYGKAGAEQSFPTPRRISSCQEGASGRPSSMPGALARSRSPPGPGASVATGKFRLIGERLHDG